MNQTKPHYGSQKAVIEYTQLPYRSSIEQEPAESIQIIKENLSKALLGNDCKNGAIFWIEELIRFISLYGFHFSKEDHIFLIKILFETTVNLTGNLYLQAEFVDILTTLLKKTYLLSREDLTLPWRPLYNVLISWTRSSKRRSTYGMGFHSVLDSLIQLCAHYFPLESTKEILELLRPGLCLHDYSHHGDLTIEAFKLFLPVSLPLQYSCQGHDLWLDELMLFWESDFLSSSYKENIFQIFGRLSRYHPGQINFDRLLPGIFERIVKSLRIPVKYKKSPLLDMGDKSLKLTHIAIFVVYNLGPDTQMQNHMDQLLKMCETYVHPSNSGSWTRLLIDFMVYISGYFSERLYRERHCQTNWVNCAAEDKKLTDEDVSRFVRCLLPAVRLCIFSKVNCARAITILSELVLLQPEIVLPPIVTQLYEALDAVTEPHRLIASLNCVTSVARHLAMGGMKTCEGEMFYAEGKKHILPLLMNSLPGIDSNDIGKCLATFKLIRSFCLVIPFVDCSKKVNAQKNLSELDRELCHQTSLFEEFVVQLLDKILTLIENTASVLVSQHDRETIGMSKEELEIDSSLSKLLTQLIANLHPSLCEILLQKLLRYVNGLLLDTSVTGRLLATVIQAFAKASPERTLKAFVPKVCKVLEEHTVFENAGSKEKLDAEAHFNLLILSSLCTSRGPYIIEFIPRITSSLKNIMTINNTIVCNLVTRVISRLLITLTMPQVIDESVDPKAFDDDSDYIHVQHWGESKTMENHTVQWYEPDQRHADAVSYIVQEIVPSQLKLIEDHISGKNRLENKKLLRTLSILGSIINAKYFFPPLQSEEIALLSSVVPLTPYVFASFSRKLEVCLKIDGVNYNVLQIINETIINLLEFMLEQGSDDVLSFKAAIQIITAYVLLSGSMRGWNTRPHLYAKATNGMPNILQRKKITRLMAIKRVEAHQKLRLLYYSNRMFTKLHQRILMNLYKLSISHYSEVRKTAQDSLLGMIRIYRSSYKTIMPSLLEILQSDPVENHKAFKGALYLCQNAMVGSSCVKLEWEDLVKLWPILVSGKLPEKPSIVELFLNIKDSILKTPSLFWWKEDVNTAVMEVIKKIGPKHGLKLEDLEQNPPVGGIKSLNVNTRTEANITSFNDLVNDLGTLLTTQSLHFRKVQLGISMLLRLAVHHPLSSPESVSAITQHLLSDNLPNRKLCVRILPLILQDLKRPYSKREVNVCEIAGEKSSSTPDNKWLLYDPKSLHYTEEEWNNAVVMHKGNIGWYCLPKTIEVYEEISKQPKLDRSYEELNDMEKVIYDCFISEKNVQKLFDFFSLEDGEKFSFQNMRLFKELMKNFGDTFLHLLEPHVKRLAAESLEGSQRFAAEVLSGIVRGTKHWPYHKAKRAHQFACEVFKIASTKIMNETMEIWSECFSYISHTRDPNRLPSIVECVLEEPLFPVEAGSFLFMSKVRLILAMIVPCSWKAAECCSRMWECAKPHLSSPFRAVRANIAFMCAYLLVHLKQGDQQFCNNHSLFADHVIPQLSLLMKPSELGRSRPITPSGSDPSHTSQVFEIETNLRMSPVTTPIAMEASTLDPSDDGNLFSTPTTDSPKLSYDNLHDRGSPIAITDDLQSSSICDKSLSPQTKPPVLEVAQSDGDSMQQESEEKRITFRLIDTVITYINVLHSVPISAFRFLPYLCNLECMNSDAELQKRCERSIANLSCAKVKDKDLDFVLNIISDICQGNWWGARLSGLFVLQSFVFYNMFTLIKEEKINVALDIVLRAISDNRIEVRQKASSVLSGFIHCQLVVADSKMINRFRKKLVKNNVKGSKSAEELSKRHTGLLGLKAIVEAFPYEVPPMVPDILTLIAHHINDPPMISNDIKLTLSNFKRTHYDNWDAHKEHFSLDQLSVLNDALVSPSYYA